MNERDTVDNPPTIRVRQSGGRRLALVLLLVVVGLSVGFVLRMLWSSRSAQDERRFDTFSTNVTSAISGNPSTIWKRLLAGLNLNNARRLLIDRPLRYLLGHKDLQAPLEPAAGRRKAEAPLTRLPALPNLPHESLDQKAASLWQGGVLSTRQGDYAWAIQQFKSCLEAQPKNEDCKKGLSEAERRLGWNRKSR